MKIDSINNINKQNFGCKRIFNVKLNKVLPDLSIDKIDAYISELNSKDEPQIENLLGSLAQTRWGKEIVEMLHDICSKGDNIPQANKFYVIERPELPFGQQVLAIAKGDINEGNIFLDRLNSKRECNPQHAISGAGSCLMYAYAKLAQVLDKNSVSLQSSSSATQFYDKLEFKRAYTDGRRDYFLSFFDFPDFLSKLEKKYSILPIK